MSQNAQIVGKNLKCAPQQFFLQTNENWIWLFLPSPADLLSFPIPFWGKKMRFPIFCHHPTKIHSFLTSNEVKIKQNQANMSPQDISVISSCKNVIFLKIGSKSWNISRMNWKCPTNTLVSICDP